jgi:triphosphoribosyl-dephospho-CoA synthetase
MNNQELRDSLLKLHAELKDIKLADKASGEILKKLGQDIQRILENSGEIPRSHHASLLKSLEESVEHFEVSHPKLAALMNTLIKNLSAMGI